MRNTILIAFALAALAACHPQKAYIPGTRVADDAVNREIIETVEKYRTAVERQDAAALFLMASPKYWEDSGTPSGKDDYGYKELKDVLTGRFSKATDIRYSMRYVSVERKCPPNSQGRQGCRAYVDVLVDASFTVPDARGGETRRDMRDQNQLVLEWNGESWKFLSGM